MTSSERAQQFWSVLVFAAREQKVVSYEMLSQMTGMANECGRELGYIFYYCRRHKLPLLNLLAVSKDTGRPGEGCPAELVDLPAQQGQFMASAIIENVSQFSTAFICHSGHLRQHLIADHLLFSGREYQDGPKLLGSFGACHDHTYLWG